MIYNSYTKQEIIESTKDAALIETYVLTGLGRGIHTDNLKYVGTSTFDIQEIENLPFDEDGKVEADIEIMGKEDYEGTVLANCCDVWPEDLTDDDKIAVIILNNELYNL
jgi:hypothetical protein